MNHILETKFGQKRFHKYQSLVDCSKFRLYWAIFSLESEMGHVLEEILLIL